MVRENRLRTIWQQGRIATNALLHLPGGFTAEIMAHAGWDCLTLDLQHGLLDYEASLPILQAISTADVTPLARVPANEAGIIGKMLDAGCYGIVCPMVNTADDVRQFVRACRYPPQGERSYGPNRAVLYGGADYPAQANGTILTLAMIETAEAVENIEQILAVPGLDGIFIGPTDLSLSLGTALADYSDPTLAAAVNTVLWAARARGSLIALYAPIPADAERFASQGVHLMTLGTDAAILTAGARSVPAAFWAGAKK